MRKVLITAAVCSLVFAGGAAASGYLITSVHQIKPSVIKKLHGARGRAGAKGAKGAAGPSGPAGISTIQDVSSTPVAYCSSSGGSCAVASATATCPAGDIATGGAANGETIDTTMSTYVGGGEYSAVLSNSSSFTGSLTVTAVCASGPGLSFQLAHAARSSKSPQQKAEALLARLRSETR